MGGIAHGNAHEKAIQLGFGQGIGAGGFHRVLGGQHHEGRGRGIGLPVDGHLVFLHDFQQGRLGFGAGAVDFIRQHDLVHDAAQVQLLLAGFQVEHREAGDVGGKHIGRELDALKGAAQRRRQGRGQRGFAQARHVLDEHVARADQGNQQVIDDGILADDDLPDIAADIVQCV